MPRFFNSASTSRRSSPQLRPFHVAILGCAPDGQGLLGKEEMQLDPPYQDAEFQSKLGPAQQVLTKNTEEVAGEDSKVHQYKMPLQDSSPMCLNFYFSPTKNGASAPTGSSAPTADAYVLMVDLTSAEKREALKNLEKSEDLKSLQSASKPIMIMAYEAPNADSNPMLQKANRVALDNLANVINAKTILCFQMTPEGTHTDAWQKACLHLAEGINPHLRSKLKVAQQQELLNLNWEQTDKDIPKILAMLSELIEAGSIEWNDSSHKTPKTIIAMREVLADHHSDTRAHPTLSQVIALAKKAHSNCVMWPFSKVLRGRSKLTNNFYGIVGSLDPHNLPDPAALYKQLLQWHPLPARIAMNTTKVPELRTLREKTMAEHWAKQKQLQGELLKEQQQCEREEQEGASGELPFNPRARGGPQW